MNFSKLKIFLLSTPGLWLLFISWALFVSNWWLPRNWGFYGFHDWDLTYATFEAGRKSIIEYGQWPAFNPYSAFGTDVLANPQSVYFSIYFIPVLIFGTFYGYKVSVLVAMIIGCWGTFKCFKLINGDSLVALLCSFLFVGCTYFSRHIFEAGHSNVIYLYFLPWIIYYFLKIRLSNRRMDYIMPVILLSQVIVGGAPFHFIVMAVFLLLWALGLCLEKKSVRPVLPFITVLVFSIGISWWKIWPVLEYWKDTPRLLTDDSGINILLWLQALGDFETDTRTWHNWFEFSLGFNLVAAGLIAFYIKNIPGYKLWLLLVIPLVWLCIGNMPPYFNPWYLLNHYVPVFTSLRAPYRFGILIVFVLALTLTRVLRDVKELNLIYTILAFAVLSQTLNFNAITKMNVQSARIEEFSTERNPLPQPIQLKPGELNRQFVYMRQDHLIQNAYEPLLLTPVTDSVVQLVGGAELVKFSPNKIIINVKDSAVKVGLRHNSSWHLEGKGELLNREGLIYIKNASGTLTLEYKNTDLKTGLLVSLISLFLMASALLFFIRPKQVL